jgi:uncharacterized membrane protein YadS
MAASAAPATWRLATTANSKAAAEIVKVAGNDLRVWAFTLAFVCIGLDLRVASLRSAGARPLLVFFVATVLGLALALLLASLIFRDFSLG